MPLSDFFKSFSMILFYFGRAQLVKRIPLQCRRPRLYSWVGMICWRRDRLVTPVFLGFPCGSAGNVGDLGLIPGLGISLGEGNGYLLQYSGLQKYNAQPCSALSCNLENSKWLLKAVLPGMFRKNHIGC